MKYLKKRKNNSNSHVCMFKEKLRSVRCKISPGSFTDLWCEWELVQTVTWLRLKEDTREDMENIYSLRSKLWDVLAILDTLLLLCI